MPQRSCRTAGGGLIYRLSDAALSCGRGRWSVNRGQAAPFPAASLELFSSFKIKALACPAFKGPTLPNVAFSVGGRRKWARPICSATLPGTALMGGMVKAGEILVQYADHGHREGRINSKGKKAKDDPELNLCINKQFLNKQAE